MTAASADSAAGGEGGGDGSDSSRRAPASRRTFAHHPRESWAARGIDRLVTQAAVQIPAAPDR